MTRFLALDIGNRRIGVAVSDPLGITTQPLETIDRQVGDPIERLLRIISENDVSTVVIGLPLELSGREGLQVEQTKKFAAKLSAALEAQKKEGLKKEGHQKEDPKKEDWEEKEAEVKLEKAISINTRSIKPRPINIVMWDERYSTKAAEHFIRGTKKKNSDRSALLDQVSAALILDSYLQSLSYS